MGYSYWRLHSLVSGSCQWHGLYRLNRSLAHCLCCRYRQTCLGRSTGAVIDSSPTVANGIVYVGSQDHKLYALNARTGTTLWTYTAGDIIDSSPTVANGVVYVGSWDGKLYAFHLPINSSPALKNRPTFFTEGNASLVSISRTKAAHDRLKLVLESTLQFGL